MRRHEVKQIPIDVATDWSHNVSHRESAKSGESLWRHLRPVYPCLPSPWAKKRPSRCFCPATLCSSGTAVQAQRCSGLAACTKAQQRFRHCPSACLRCETTPWAAIPKITHQASDHPPNEMCVANVQIWGLCGDCAVCARHCMCIRNSGGLGGYLCLVCPSVVELGTALVG